MTRRAALAAVVLSAFCFSTAGIFAKWAFAQGVGPLPLLAARFAGASVLMGVLQAVRQPRALAVTGADLGRFTVLSLTGYGAASVCYFFGVREAGAAVTTVLLFTYPAIVVAIDWATTRVRPGLPKVGALALTFGGCALVANAGAAGRPLSPAGLALGLGAGLAYAVYNVLSYRWVGRRPRAVLMTYMFAISAVVMVSVGLLTGTPMSVAGWAAGVWWLLGLIILVPTFAAVLLYLGGIRRLGPSQAAVVSTLEPLFAVVLAYVLLGERLSAVQLGGVALVLGGVVLAEWSERRAGLDEVAGV